MVVEHSSSLLDDIAKLVALRIAVAKDEMSSKAVKESNGGRVFNVTTMEHPIHAALPEQRQGRGHRPVAAVGVADDSQLHGRHARQKGRGGNLERVRPGLPPQALL
jgi:hypothetical protein